MVYVVKSMSEFVEYFSDGNSLVDQHGFLKFGLQGELKHYKKGQYLIEQGLPAPNIFFLTKGLVRYVSISPEGKEFTQSFSSAPGIAGSTRAMVFESEALFSIEALDDVLSWQFNWQDFFATMKLQSGFLEAYSRLLEHMFAKKEAREYTLLQQTAEQRYLEFMHDHPNLKELVPLKIIASYIGITPIALSRIRKKLK